MQAIYLPKLNNLTPSMESTLFKAVEEAGELAREVLAFLPYEQLTARELEQNRKAQAILGEVAAELLDVAQTCITMIFVMEDDYGIKLDCLLDNHLEKLKNKGYKFTPQCTYKIATLGNFKYINLPELAIPNVSLLTTVCKIEEELGEFTQYMGKFSGASGETRRLSQDELTSGLALELMDVAQCCFTMMYILAERYKVDIQSLTEKHCDKLKQRGYYS